MIEIKEFRGQKFITKPIRSGFYNVIYELTEQHVVKVNRPDRDATVEDLVQESQVAHQLYNEGVSVPKPEGIFKVKIRWGKNLYGLWFPTKIGFVMEKINGINGDEINGDLRKKVEELHQIELEKCWKLGFFTGDIDLSNSIYDSVNAKSYLIDFYGWALAAK